ncbi:hypothetical protein NC651_032083 [Populus alba x Populus x berolinensis]|nr:hypothetical protein NC651_032083 [Populus alba x Populus x berolinensis]
MAHDLSSISPLLSKISQNLSALLMLAVSKLLARDITNFLQAVATLVLPLHATKNWYCV